MQSAQKIWNDWWQNFIKWAFVGVGGAFALWISSSLMTTQVSADKLDFFDLLVILIILGIGFKITTKSSAAGAGMVMGLAGGAAGFAMGASKKIGGAVLEKTGRTKTGQAIREKLGSAKAKIAEATGFAPQGHAAGLDAKRKAETKTRLENQRNSSDVGSRQAYENAVRHGRGTTGATAVALANEKGDFAKIMGPDLNVQKARMAHAMSSGYQKSDFLKSNPNLAGSPQEIQAATAKISPTKAAEWHESVMTPEVAANLSANQVKEIGEKGSPELVNKVKAFKHDSTKNLAGQSSEWIKARLNIARSGAPGSVERTRAENNWANLQKRLSTDANFA